MKKIAVIGSLNKDLVVKVAKLPKPGETVIAESSSEFLGGKGANQAVAAAKMSAHVTMMGMIGDDNDGQWLIDSLEENNVLTNHIIRTKRADTGLAVVSVDESGENSVMVVAGANHQLNIDYIESNRQSLMDMDFILLQLEIPIEVVEYAINVGKALNKFIILNPAPACDLKDNVIKNIDMLTPNATELAHLSGMKVETISDVKVAASKMINKGVKQLIVTLGAKGAYYTDGKIEQLYDGIKVESVDTTGAGDCFNGVLVASMSQNFTIKESIKRAIIASAMSVVKPGAQNSIPEIAEVEQFMKQNNIEY